MVFTAALYASLAIFILGLLYKIGTWLTRQPGLVTADSGAGRRLARLAAGIARTVFSLRIFTLIRAFITDVLLQRSILRESFTRWIMHMLIFWGFILLVFMHALGQIVTDSLFSDYESTLNPYFFLRDLFGFMVLAGIVIAVIRRISGKVPRLKTNGMDIYAIAIVAVIILSGFLLAGMKISSKTEFSRMVDDYAGLQGQEALALEMYWASKEGLVSDEITRPFDQDDLEQGKQLHESYCAYCHAPAQSAFTSFSFSRILSPIAVPLDRAGFVNILWYIHFLSCFLALACLPFSKMLHIFSTPASLLTKAASDPEKTGPENTATRQAMELDACTHCCTCSLYCSAMMGYDAKNNACVLPSEKIAPLKALAAGKTLGDKEFDAILEGIYLCTNCDRCTVVCPSGINLKRLWTDAREKILSQGRAEPLVLSQLSFARGLNRANIDEDIYGAPLKKADGVVRLRYEYLLEPGRTIELDRAEEPLDLPVVSETTFSYCFGCRTCTTVCPVVGNYENPEEELGLLPHQIMCSLGLGLSETALAAEMLWYCLTCYQCQEHCPQNVRVTDILYELKYAAARKAEAEQEPEI